MLVRWMYGFVIAGKPCCMVIQLFNRYFFNINRAFYPVWIIDPSIDHFASLVVLLFCVGTYTAFAGSADKLCDNLSGYIDCGDEYYSTEAAFMEPNSVAVAGNEVFVSDIVILTFFPGDSLISYPSMLHIAWFSNFYAVSCPEHSGSRILSVFAIERLSSAMDAWHGRWRT